MRRKKGGALDALVRLSAEARRFESAAHFAEWDQETMMPPGAAGARADLLGTLQAAHHARLTAPAYAKGLGALCDLRSGEPRPGLGALEASLARGQWRRWNRARRLPGGLVEETARTSSAAQHAWVDARRKSDFRILRPHLERLLALKRQAASRLGGAHPYDPLLDEYEPGMTVARLDPLLGALKAPLGELARAGKGRGRAGKALSTPYGDEPALDAFTRELASAMGFDLSRGRIDRSAHPFSTGLHPTDCRFTLRISGDGVMTQVLTALHECGHSLYEQGLDPAWWGTTLSRHASLGLHESMSRLWENLVGKSAPFWRHRLPLLRRAFPRLLAGVGLDDVLAHLHRITPGPVRLEADEVTYSLHILLRYELEKDMVTGKLPVKDIPDAWAAKSRELLGLVPPDDRRGCLQDVHWSGGSIGYFPTYVLGNLYGAQLYAKFKEETPSWDARLARGELTVLTRWLQRTVYRHGRRWPAAELVRRAPGAEPSAEPFLAHLRSRYT
ncbi:MAG: carboxypeptidase M32 [Elusimicrobia bacterium]|nr:carboxypeptidase M32 [Elusimicrobiota bacterium]